MTRMVSPICPLNREAARDASPALAVSVDRGAHGFARSRRMAANPHHQAMQDRLAGLLLIAGAAAALLLANSPLDRYLSSRAGISRSAR